MSRSFYRSISAYCLSYFYLVSSSFYSTFFLLILSSYFSCSCLLYHSSISFFLTNTISARASSTIWTPPKSSILSSSKFDITPPAVPIDPLIPSLMIDYSQIEKIKSDPSVPVENKYLLSGEIMIFVTSPA